MSDTDDEILFAWMRRVSGPALLKQLTYTDRQWQPPQYADSWERTPWLDKGQPIMSYMKRKLEDEAEEAAERVVAEMHENADDGEVTEYPCGCVTCPVCAEAKAEPTDYMRPIDQFAYAALNGYLAHGTFGDVDCLALDCYDIAEAMMAERAKRESNG